ncbi:MAG: hypothetical protein LBE80_01730 [Deltaproteobacteria bacterium]|nr:hypothetical protein [Deltaproteobacteria bacterium]
MKVIFTSFQLGLDKTVQNFLEDETIKVETAKSTEFIYKAKHRFSDIIYLLTNKEILYIEFVTNYTNKVLNQIFSKLGTIYDKYNTKIHTVIIHNNESLSVERPEIDGGSFIFKPKHVFLASLDSNKIFSAIEEKLNKGEPIYYELLLIVCSYLIKELDVQSNFILKTYKLIKTHLSEDIVIDWLSLNEIFVKKSVLLILQDGGEGLSHFPFRSLENSSPAYQALYKEKEELLKDIAKEKAARAKEKEARDKEKKDIAKEKKAIDKEKKAIAKEKEIPAKNTKTYLALGKALSKEKN